LRNGRRSSEALQVRVQDVRVVNGVAKSMRVIGKGNRERLVPLPEAFGQVFGFWLNDKGKENFFLFVEARSG
jgi:integrase/recombinase XerD